MNTYKVTVDEETFELLEDAGTKIDLVSSSSNTYHILNDNQSVNAEVVMSDFNKKEIIVSINGNSYSVKIEDQYDQLVTKMGLSSTNNKVIKSIKAPMPGLILDILVEVGQEIEKGTQLVILEAMKMENILKSEGDGTIKSIEISKGEAVEKGQIIIEMQ